ncbi:MAG: OB-fold domain-containing protein [Actinomycetota bacterium]
MPLILPTIDDVNRPYWDGAKEGVLRLQRCGACNELRYPISPVCPSCMSTELSWETVSGRAEVYTFAVFRHAYNDAWSGRIPYAVAIVELAEGPFVIADIVDADPAEVRVGMPVQVRFDEATPDVTVPRFAPA